MEPNEAGLLRDVFDSNGNGRSLVVVDHTEHAASGIDDGSIISFVSHGNGPTLPEAVKEQLMCLNFVMNVPPLKSRLHTTYTVSNTMNKDGYMQSLTCRQSTTALQCNIREAKRDELDEMQVDEIPMSAVSDVKLMRPLW
jgi:hypothetical protein